MSKFSFPANVLFRHIRLYDQFDELSATGGYTAAYYIDHEEQVVDFAIAKCRSNELFDRQKGRTTSLERLTKYREGDEVISTDGRPMAYTFTAADLSEVISKDFDQRSNQFIEEFFFANLRKENAEKEISCITNSPKAIFTLTIEEVNVRIIVDQIEYFIDDTGL